MPMVWLVSGECQMCFHTRLYKSMLTSIRSKQHSKAKDMAPESNAKPRPDPKSKLARDMELRRNCSKVTQKISHTSRFHIYFQDGPLQWTNATISELDWQRSVSLDS